MKQLFIKGIGHSHPKNIITNQFLTDLNIGTNDQWIMERVGIRERRTILSLDHIKNTLNENRTENIKFINEGTKSLVLEASDLAFQRAQIKKEQIDLVIAGGCTQTSLIPSDAARYANILGINAPSIDFNSACSSWTAGIHFSRSLSDYKNILLINCEVPTAHVSYVDRKNCVLIGDACAATILSRNDGEFFVEDSLFNSNPTGCDKVVLPINGFFEQDGPAVQKFAISHMIKLYEALNRDGSVFIGHQANSRALESVVNRFGIQKHFSNIEYYGNTFAAGAASVFSQNYENEDLNNVVVGTVGSGLTWAGARLIRNKND
ncbi:ketoacyl-ACP synthase III [Candidatus Woesearchaeota archaeon]|nr:ketoacyl-ACP synthase III [Candidatus Woesearchaeota archaeon]